MMYMKYVLSGVRISLDLRFADDILLFATPSAETVRMVDAIVTCLKEVGLKVGFRKLKFNNPSADTTLTTQDGLEMEALDATKAHE